MSRNPYPDLCRLFAGQQQPYAGAADFVLPLLPPHFLSPHPDLADFVSVTGPAVMTVRIQSMDGAALHPDNTPGRAKSRRFMTGIGCSDGIPLIMIQHFSYFERSD